MIEIVKRTQAVRLLQYCRRMLKYSFLSFVNSELYFLFYMIFLDIFFKQTPEDCLL